MLKTATVIAFAAILLSTSASRADEATAPPPAFSPQETPPKREPPPPDDTRPRVLKWSEGGEIPAGYHKETGAPVGLVVAGSIAFGTAWVPSAILAGPGRLPTLAIPVVGPVIAASTLRIQEGFEFIVGGAFVLDAIQQGVGAAMLIYAFAGPQTRLVRDRPESAKTQWFPTPMSFGKGSVGLGIAGTM